MTLTVSIRGRNAACNALVDEVDVGSTNAAGKLRLYDDAALTTLLVEIDLNNPAFGAAASGTAALVVSPSLSGTAVAAATATIAVVLDRDESEVYRGTVTESGGGGDFIISDSTIAVSDIVQINSASVTIPAS